jgi:hypothetical protein
MQSKLQTALYNYIKTTNTFSTAIGGRFWFDNVPEGTTFPYAVGYILDQIPSRDTCDKWERFTFQLTIFQKKEASLENILSIAEKAMGLLDDCHNSLTITGYTGIDVDRITSLPIQLDSVDFAQYVIRYSIIIQKT